MKNPAENNKRVAKKHVVPLFPYDSYHAGYPLYVKGACWQNWVLMIMAFYNVVGGVVFNVLFPGTVACLPLHSVFLHSSLVEVIRTN
mgnify:CR=1 FL=1